LKGVTVRLSPTDEQRAKKIFDYFGANGDSFSEQYRDFLNRCSQFLDNAEKAEQTVKVSENLTPIYCKLRFSLNTVEGIKFYCANRPPKATPLLDLAICRVCTAIRYNIKLTENNQVKEQKETVPEKEPEQTTPPALPEGFIYKTIADFQKVSRDVKSDGSRWCPFSTCRKYPLDCEKCKKQNKENWDFCLSVRYGLTTRYTQNQMRSKPNLSVN